MRGEDDPGFRRLCFLPQEEGKAAFCRCLSIQSQEEVRRGLDTQGALSNPRGPPGVHYNE